MDWPSCYDSCQLLAQSDLTTMTASAEAGRQGRSKYRQSGGGEGDLDTSPTATASVSYSVNNQSTKTFVSKLRRSLQYGTFKVNHLHTRDN